MTVVDCRSAGVIDSHSGRATRLAAVWVEQVCPNPEVRLLTSALPYTQCHLAGRVLLPSVSTFLGDELPGMDSSKVKETSWTDVWL